MFLQHSKCEKIRADLVLAHLAWADSEKGARILASVESFETRFGDGSNVCEVDSEGPSRQPRGCTKVQIVGACLDPRNVPNLPGIPAREVEAAWAHVKDMLVEYIDETRAAEEAKRDYVSDDGEAAGDWLAAASSAASHAVSGLRSSSVIAAKEGRKVLAVPATSAAPERMFSAAGNIMTKKRARLTCDHLQELMYLHEVWAKVREWKAIKKARLA